MQNYSKVHIGSFKVVNEAFAIRNRLNDKIRIKKSRQIWVIESHSERFGK